MIGAIISQENPNIIQTDWLDNPLIAALPAASVCNCAFVTLQEPSYGSYLPIGTQMTVVNTCASNLKVFAINDRALRNAGIPLLTPAKWRHFAYQTLTPDQKMTADVSKSIGVALWIENCPGEFYQPAPAGMPTDTTIRCLSHKKLVSSAPVGPPVACGADGSPPGADCVCQVGPVAHPGVIWQGEPPPPIFYQ
jgi:hypothetical protein